MDKRWILIVAVVIFDVTSAGWDKNWQKFKPPHHWHDCGSSEKDWDNLPDQGMGRKDWDHFDKADGWDNGGWVYPDQKPRPPWPRPKPPPKPITSTTPQPTSTPPIVTSRSPEVIQACLRTCPVTSQYNPVCGSDGVTYSNVGRLECARFCGVDVQLSRSTACSTDDGSSSTTSTTTTARPDFQACISRCPVTPEYNPVCGSDGVTYANLGRLECAKICGVNVQLSRNTRCPNPVTPTPAPVITTPNNGGATIDKDILDLIFTTTTESADGSGLIDERHQDE